MIIKGCIISGHYFDSVTLMSVAKKISGSPGVIDAAVVMGTKENRSILAGSGLLLKEFENATDSDLLFAIKAENNETAENLISRIDEFLKSTSKKDDEKQETSPRSIESACKFLSGANLALISIAGKYAAAEAMKALEQGMHVMIFSDNVSLEKELELKKYAIERGLMVMGPDCGTAIINGTPLAFANVVNRGEIGIVAASGTGLQEVSCIISNSGKGVSQAIGTGGRDVKKEVGGIMFIEALKALGDDPNTKVLVLVSKTPHSEVLKKISKALNEIKKPKVAVFFGVDANLEGVHVVKTLEEAAFTAVNCTENGTAEEVQERLRTRRRLIKEAARRGTEKLAPGQKYVRGLFSGGTFCSESQVIFKNMYSNMSGNIWSNVPIEAFKKLKNSWQSKEHTLIDLGEDEFTVGRPHPMIDYSLRNRKIVDEASDKETAVILLDVVLGYGSNMKPLKDLLPVLEEAKSIALENGRYLPIVCSITGTELDPQNRNKVEAGLKEAGVIVMSSNAEASEFAGYVATCLGTALGEK